MKRAKKKQKSRVQNQPDPRNAKLPFIEHLYELRRRLFYVVLSIGIWSTGAYFVQQHIVNALLKPAHNQHFIYTTVGGGIDFLFRICVYTGIVFSIPVIMFQVLKYLEPLIKRDAMRFMLWGSVVSGALAVAGMAFGYFVGLPSALHFLLNQFSTGKIEALLTIQSYMSFVTLYMLGSALLFQGPLLLVLINRIKPLKPSKLLGLERWVILIAFVLGGIMNPSPRWQDQVLLAGPMIIAYQIGVILVWLANRHGKRPARITTMIEQDNAVRQERLAKLRQARPVYLPASTIQASSRPMPAVSQQTVPQVAATQKKPANTPQPHPAIVRTGRLATRPAVRPRQYIAARRPVPVIAAQTTVTE